ncbi:hypothetical protein ACFSFY_08590 [Sporosarcina siberiensis]|uniref:Sporulation and spore germination n=1 Tax=Sporosarcina siberiensis TaxID=1365606 RepID=A0ABW4SFD2_9BACL
MTENKWDDKSIEQLLSDMPNITDNRSEKEVLMRLKKDERLKSPVLTKRKRWVPAVVAAAALVVLSLLIPSMFKKNDVALTNNSSDKQMESRSIEENEASEDSKMDFFSDDSAAKTSVEENMFESFAVYENDIAGDTVFHLGLAGDAAESVPVTFIIPAEKIREDFGEVQPTSLDLYKKYADQIDEEAFGFSDYHPYKGSLSVEGEMITHVLPTGHNYDMGSGSIAVYIHSLQDTFYGFKHIRFENEDGSIHEFDQAGEPSKPLELKSGKNNTNYYLFIQSNGLEFLSSNFYKSYDSLDKALQEMKVKPNDIFLPLIPDNIDFSVTIDKNLARVKFAETLDLNLMLPTEALRMIEGMLLTAASFDTQLQFENISQVEWQRFDFTQPLPMPIGPNPMEFLLK